jgi:hypothetical protein
MNVKRIAAAAGLALSMAVFAPPVFAQIAGGAVGGLEGGNSLTGSAPALGQPGTEHPASGAPLGAASSDFMSSEHGHPSHEFVPPGTSARQERDARQLEVDTGRDIVAARAQGLNVAKAQRQRWLGSYALVNGDRTNALRHFRVAEQDLRTQGYNRTAMNGRAKVNESRTNLNAEETDQTPDAANMHPNQARSVY